MIPRPYIADWQDHAEQKEIDLNFIGDMEALLRPEIEYDQEAAFEWLKNELIKQI